MMKGHFIEKGIVCGIVLLFLGTGFAGANTISSTSQPTDRGLVEVVDQQQTGSGPGWVFNNDIWIAQGFTPTISSLTRVALFLFRGGMPPDNTQITVSIRSNLYGNDLAAVSVDGSYIGPVADWIDFDFPDLTVTPGVEYYIVCRASAGDSSNSYCWVFVDNNLYTGGDAWGYYYGLIWLPMDDDDHPSTDCCFMTFGMEESPTVPEITGASSGKIGITYNLTIRATDPDDTTVSYLVDWGDDQTSGWIGPYVSGEPVTVLHVWEKRGSYTVQVKARDAYNAESDWGSMKIKMPYSNDITGFGMVEWFFARFPNAFPLLWSLLRG